jgi:hypothetical protein
MEQWRWTTDDFLKAFNRFRPGMKKMYDKFSISSDPLVHIPTTKVNLNNHQLWHAGKGGLWDNLHRE